MSAARHSDFSPMTNGSQTPHGGHRIADDCNAAHVVSHTARMLSVGGQSWAAGPRDCNFTNIPVDQRVAATLTNTEGRDSATSTIRCRPAPTRLSRMPNAKVPEGGPSQGPKTDRPAWVLRFSQQTGSSRPFSEYHRPCLPWSCLQGRPRYVISHDGAASQGTYLDDGIVEHESLCSQRVRHPFSHLVLGWRA